jgi:hypothetical protein
VLGCNWPYLAAVKHVNKLIELLLKYLSIAVRLEGGRVIIRNAFPYELTSRPRFATVENVDWIHLAQDRA